MYENVTRDCSSCLTSPTKLGNRLRICDSTVAGGFDRRQRWHRCFALMYWASEPVGGCHLSLSPVGAGHTPANHANGCSRPFPARPWLRAAPAEEGPSGQPPRHCNPQRDSPFICLLGNAVSPRTYQGPRLQTICPRNPASLSPSAGG